MVRISTLKDNLSNCLGGAIAEYPAHFERHKSLAMGMNMALRSLKKAGVQPSDLVGIYCALIRSVLEYAAPVWSGLPAYLSNVLEVVQRRAMRIIFPHADYNTALCSAWIPR